MRSVNIAKKNMYVNVILSFNTLNECGENQEFFELKLPVSKKEISAAQFMHSKFFKKVVAKCKKYNRNPEDLIKISTASDWGFFEEFTGLPSLIELGHPCKWFFGNGRGDLDAWERALTETYGFGTAADMSYLSQKLENAHRDDGVLTAA